MDRANILKIAQTAEDRMLLAKVWDKITIGMQRNIVSFCSFLSLREQQMCRYLFGDIEGLIAFGGYEEAERKMLIYLPEYMDTNFLYSEDSPLACIRATFYENDALTHRDFLGALMAAGIRRESIGDICVSHGSCDFFAVQELAEYIVLNFQSAGRTKLHLCQIPITDAAIPQAETTQIRDTVASMRLDSIISAGFRISRNLAMQHIIAGRAAIDGLPCEKPDKSVEVGCKISVRGMGKILLKAINGQTKKGRISVMIDRYI